MNNVVLKWEQAVAAMIMAAVSVGVSVACSLTAGKDIGAQAVSWGISVMLVLLAIRAIHRE